MFAQVITSLQGHCNYLLGFDLDTLDLWKLGVRGQIVFFYCSSSSLLAKGASCCVPIDQISRPFPRIIVTEMKCLFSQ